MNSRFARLAAVSALVICCLALAGCTDLNNSVIIAELRHESAQEPNVFEDDLARIQFGFAKDGVTIDLTNKSKIAVYIEWDSSAIVDPNERTHRIAHAGVKYADTGSAHPPTLVPPGARLTDILMPTDNISFDGKSWKTGELFRQPEKLIGRSFAVYLSLRPLGHEPLLYRFDFIISGTRDRKLFGQ